MGPERGIYTECGPLCTAHGYGECFAAPRGQKVKSMPIAFVNASTCYIAKFKLLSYSLHVLIIAESLICWPLCAVLDL